MTQPPPSGAIVAVGDARPAGGGVSNAIVATGEAGLHLPDASELLAIKKLATQTKAIGVILPPPDIRAIVDKTAAFVAKNGAWSACRRPRSHAHCAFPKGPDFTGITIDAIAGTEFERRILGNEQNNVKFNFLQPHDPYHAYYKLRVSAIDGAFGKLGCKQYGVGGRRRHAARRHATTHNSHAACMHRFCPRVSPCMLVHACMHACSLTYVPYGPLHAGPSYSFAWHTA
eukprot:366134-Chlamydomonas_euryale.AAC.16